MHTTGSLQLAQINGNTLTILDEELCHMKFIVSDSHMQRSFT